MDDRTEVLSLRRVAARFINTDEQTGLAELDRIAADASRVIQKRYWLLFLMHRLKGMSYREISEQIGVGENGVEYHMMRALDRCRRAAARLQ